MDLKFTFSDNTVIITDFILDNSLLKLTECYHSNLKSVDDSLTVKIPFNETLCDKLKADISKNIKAQLRADDGSNIFTGYARKTLSFSKTQRNQPFSLEVVPPSFLLDIDYSGTAIHIDNTTISNVIITLIGLTSFSGTINTSKMQDEKMLIFTLSDGDNIKSVLEELLFEYGYIYTFDNNGNFIVKPLFCEVPSEITQHFDGANCLNQISQTVKEDSCSQVSVSWIKFEKHNDVLIFEDTTGADTTNSANIEIEKGAYYLGEEHNYLEYDSKFQDIAWIISAKPVIEYDDKSNIISTFENLGTKADLKIYNGSTGTRKITKLQITGTGYFEIATNQNKAGDTNGTRKEITAKYIQSDGYATNLAKALRNYYNYANFSISLQSKEKFEIGTYCDVSDYGIGTIKCRIIKRVWNIHCNTYEYTLESITEYDPTETVTTTSTSKSKNDNGETLRGSVIELNKKVGELGVNTITCTADRTSAVIELDADGKTTIAQDIPVTIKLQQSNRELEFFWGGVALPDGWTYSTTEKTITFHIGEGVKVRGGQILIPVQYRLRTEYQDENGEIYEDENGIPYFCAEPEIYDQWKIYLTYYGTNGGVYLGMFTSLSEIPTNGNYGDWFTWGGNDTESAISYDGKFIQSRVYTYVGDTKDWQWEADYNALHGQAALSDVLSIANADLKNNNSTAWEYLNHLTANDVYTDLIIANSAFIEKLATKIISVKEIATIGNVDNALIQLVGSENVSGHTIIAGGKIKADLIDVAKIKATSGFFDNVTTNGVTANNITTNGMVANNATINGAVTANDLKFVCEAGDVPLFSLVTPTSTTTSSYVTFQIIATGTFRLNIRMTHVTSDPKAYVYKNGDLYATFTQNGSQEFNVTPSDIFKVVGALIGRYSTIVTAAVLISKENTILKYLGVRTSALGTI